MKNLVFFDIEVENNNICDLGAIKGERTIHTKNVDEFVYFLKDCNFLCGHNIISHDLKYLNSQKKKLKQKKQLMKILHIFGLKQKAKKLLQQ